ncbi:MAG: hypothetical protein AAFU03_04585, partial [Bacteroidota bacterium]
IGLRVTKLYLVDSDSEIYIPNASLGSKDIINLSRPTPHVARTIELEIKVDTDQKLATKILQETVLGHPDTLGKFPKARIAWFLTAIRDLLPYSFPGLNQLSFLWGLKPKFVA